MICVSIGRGRHRHMMAEHRHLVEQGAELVELRLDYIRSKINLPRLLENRPCPVVITIRREQDGGMFAGSEEQRLVLLRTAIAAGVEYVDLEEDVAKKIPRFGKTKRIISHHDFRKTPDDLDALHARLAALDADIVKIATMANHPCDNFRMLELVARSPVPTVGMCMGDIGVPSRLLTGRFGAPFTYATFNSERALAPGQLSFDEMRNVYNYDTIRPDTEVYGVIGDPIGHSLSPLIHNRAFRELNLNKVYVPFRVPPESLPAFLNDAREFGLKGISVTIPHKEAILPHLVYRDESVAAINAANTIVYEGTDLRGYNTDYQAAMDSLEHAVAQIDDGAIAGRTALVLGSGGAAKAVAYGLKKRKAEVVIASRTAENAERLAQYLECTACAWDRRSTIKADIIVNCTPLGMHPKVDQGPMEKNWLRPGSVVFDTVYNPENTLLIKDAKERSCYTVSGVDMFVRQAALQFKLFTGEDAPVEAMHETLKRATSAVKY